MRDLCIDFFALRLFSEGTCTHDQQQSCRKAGIRAVAKLHVKCTAELLQYYEIVAARHNNKQLVHVDYYLSCQYSYQFVYLSI